MLKKDQIKEVEELNIGPKASDYMDKDPRLHVYEIPDTYIGSDEKCLRTDWILDVDKMKMEYANIELTPGIERIYMEILSNASDNVGKSRRSKVDAGKIEIEMSNSTISITNYGLPIPVELTKDRHGKEVYVPHLSFGYLLAGSNFTKERHEAGKNGIGAKATNIFSKQFAVIIHDHIRHLKYTQIWLNNMSECGEPLIEQYSGKISSVQIIYLLDFERFGYPLPIERKEGDVVINEGGYPNEAFKLFARHAADISFTSKVPVIFNGKVFNFTKIKSYALLYFSEESVKNAVVHYQWPAGTEMDSKGKIPLNKYIVPEVELIALDTPNSSHHISFVNCMMTKDGGVHVDSAINAVCEPTVSMINENVLKGLTKKGKQLDKKDKNAYTINMNNVKPHISLLLSVRVINPKFDSQSKTKLTHPKPKIFVDDNKLRVINSWNLIDQLHHTLEAKQLSNMSKTDGKRSRFVKLRKGIDANNAGKSLKNQCVLYVTEGNSGACYAEKLIGHVNGGRDNIGLLPMRGKGLNVMNASIKKIVDNKEIIELKKMLGLQEGLDYTLNENFNKLRYQGLMIMADADVDGKHIIGLLLTFFHCRYPTLLARGFVMYYKTPIIRASLGKQIEKFYTEQQYIKWLNSTPNSNRYTVKYYKGLGTSDDKEISEDFKDPYVVYSWYDDKAPNSIRLAFDKKYSDQRKQWISSWQQVDESETRLEMQPISEFINNELILFSIENLKRSLPKLMDGFKESQRKIIYGAHCHWKNIGSKTPYKELKIARFASLTAEKASYHHGEVILSDVIIGMIQDFTSSNNIPWFCKNGQFGTRNKGGKNAAQPRYTNTEPSKLFHLILRKEDLPILTHLEDEGEKIEPEVYYPVIPMVLINGCQGVATGWSTTVPNFNPIDVIAWLRMKLQGTPDDLLPNLIPWYRGFTGLIKVIDRRNKRNIKVITSNNNGIIDIASNDISDDLVGTSLPQEEDEDNNDNNNNEIDERPLLSMISYGKFYSDVKTGDIIITELPIGRWPHNYSQWLVTLLENKKIKDFKDNSIDNTVHFTIKGFKDDVNYRTLRLSKTIGMSNMVLLDDNNKPVRYNTPHEIIEAFYCRRLPIYQKRKDWELTNLYNKMMHDYYKIKYIRAIKTKQLNVENSTKDEIFKQLDILEIPHHIHKDSKIKELSIDAVKKLEIKYQEKQQQMQILQETTPEQMYLNDLTELELELNKIYPPPPTPSSNNVPNFSSKRKVINAPMLNKNSIRSPSILSPSIKSPITSNTLKS